MRWRVLVELAGASGAVEAHEVGVGERLPSCRQRKAPQVLDGLSCAGHGQWTWVLFGIDLSPRMRG